MNMEKVIINNEIIFNLINQVKGLQLQMDELKEERLLVSQDSLVKLWDNEYDERWNEY